MKRLFTLLCLIVLSSVTLHPAYALKISPFKTTLVPGKDGGSEVFRIENNSTEPAAVLISILTWEIKPDGEEVNRDAEDDFVIFPSQLVLKPHESKAVRVQWLGNPSPSAEIPYRIVAEQVAINLKDTPEEESGMKFMLKFMGGLYIAPAKVKSDISVQKVEKIGSHLRVTLINQGSGHSLLYDPVLTLTLSDGKIMTLNEKQLAPLAGSNMHAGNTRFFDIPLPAGFGGSVSSAHIEFNPGF